MNGLWRKCLVLILALAGGDSRAEIRAAAPVFRGESGDFTWTVTAFDDTSPAMTEDLVLKPDNLARFRPVNTLSLYATGNVVRWFLIRIDNPFHHKLVFNIKKAAFSSLKIFELAGAHAGNLRKTFDFEQKTWRDVFSPHFVHFLGDESQGSTAMVLVRVTSQTRLVLPITVMAREQAAANLSMSALAVGGYYGSILVMTLYNAFLFFFIGDLIYLFFVVYLLAFVVTQLAVDGFLPVLFAILRLPWTGHLGVLCGDLTLIFLTLYSRRFLDLKNTSRRLDLLALMACGVFALALTVSPWLPYALGVNTTYVLNFACSLVLLVIGFGSFLHGYRPARYFILGNAVLIGASILMALVMLEVVRLPNFDAYAADYLVKFGSALEVVFFSFALADRVNMLAAAQERAQTALHAAEVRRLESEKTLARETAKANQYQVLAQLTQTLAHDIRKPFSMIKIALERMATLGDDPSDVKNAVGKIRLHIGKAFDDVNRLISDVMEISTGKASLHSSRHSLRALVAAALAQTFRYHASTNIELRVAMRHRFLCRIDEYKIQRVLVNLLDNARQAMGGTGTISIISGDGVGPKGGMVELVVKNTNSWIAAEDAAHIFEPFFTKGKKGGTGLGLAICRQIIEAHGGQIRCISSRELGTSFHLTIPAIIGTVDSQAPLWPANSAEIYREFDESMAS